jgi:hypothetical protein
MLEYCGKKPAEFILAEEMLSDAGISHDPANVGTLAMLLRQMEHASGLEAGEAAFQLLRRIGGSDNLRGYLGCWMVGGVK